MDLVGHLVFVQTVTTSSSWTEADLRAAADQVYLKNILYLNISII